MWIRKDFRFGIAFLPILSDMFLRGFKAYLHQAKARTIKEQSRYKRQISEKNCAFSFAFSRYERILDMF